MKTGKKIIYILIISTLIILTPVKLFTVEITAKYDDTLIIATTEKVIINNYVDISFEDESITSKEFYEQ